ncbi:MAG: hypothetical protein QXV82_10000 [Ignisphaera sp.]
MVAPAIIAAIIITAGAIISTIPIWMQVMQQKEVLEKAEELQQRQAEISRQNINNMIQGFMGIVIPLMMMQMMMNMMTTAIRPPGGIMR